MQSDLYGLFLLAITIGFLNRIYRVKIQMADIFLTSNTTLFTRNIFKHIFLFEIL